MNKKNVAVLMGGKSSEYDVSVLSGDEVVNNLDREKYKVNPILISREGIGWEKLFDTKENIDFVFIAMHGKYGEDGSIQGMLDLLGLKYSGSGVLASAIGMNKLLFRELVVSENVRIPKYIAFTNENTKNIKSILGNPPYFVKPNSQGSSVGAAIVNEGKGLETAIRKAFDYGDIVLVDEYINGTEVTCAVLGNTKPIALPLIEIVPKKSNFFDYNSKYSDSGSDEIVPARLSEKLSFDIQKIAIKVYELLGCKGFARIDFLLKNNEIPYVLEINTIPGLTPVSLFPKAAMAAGISYPELLDRIINLRLE